MWSHLKGLLSEAGIYALGNASTTLLSLLLVPLYTHFFSAAEFGVYSLLLTVYSLLSTLAEGGLSEGLARLFFDEADSRAEDPARSARLVLITFSLSVVTTALIAILLFLGAPWIAREIFHEAAYTEDLRILAGALFFRGLGVIPIFYLRIRRRPVAFAALTTLQIVSFLTLNVFMVVFLRLGVRGVFWSLLVSSIIHAVVVMSTAFGGLGLAAWRWPHATGSTVKALYRISLPLLPVSLFLWVVDFGDRYLLDLYTTKAQVGLYSLGYRFGQIVLFFVTAFSLGWTPIRYQILSLEAPQVVYGRIMTFYVATMGFVWLGLGLYCHEVIVLVATPAFHAAEEFVPVIGFAYLLYGIFGLTTVGAGVAKRLWGIPVVVFLAAVVNLACNLLWIPTSGALGSAYATVAAYGVMAFGAGYLSQRVYPIPYEYVPCGLLIGSALLLRTLGTPLGGFPLALSLALKLLPLVLYLGVVKAVGVLTRAEWERLWRAVSPRLPQSMQWVERLF